MPDPTTDAPDALLVAYIAEGYSECVAPLVARYHKALSGFLRRATRGRPEHEDLYQETWLRVVRSARRYDPSYPFATWLFRIALNLTRDYWKRQCRHRHHFDHVDIETVADYPDRTPGTEDATATLQDARSALELLDLLPERLSEAILLRYVEELSEKEMAQRLGVPGGTVKSRLHHGLKRLRALLQGELQ
jgi:RNA polymerase sigma factor (sigma-70 family)